MIARASRGESPYEFMGVSPSAAVDEIKKAYRKLALRQGLNMQITSLLSAYYSLSLCCLRSYLSQFGNIKVKADDKMSGNRNVEVAGSEEKGKNSRQGLLIFERG